MRKPLPRTVVLLGMTSMLTDVSSEMIVSLLPLLMLGPMGATPLMVGLVDGVADAVSAVLKLVAGRASDRMGKRKPWLLAGYGLSFIVRPLISFALTPLHIVAIRATDRIGKGLRTAPRDALLVASVPFEDAPRAFAFHRAMDHSGAVVGPVIAAALIAGGVDVRIAIALAWIPASLGLASVFFTKDVVSAPAVTGPIIEVAPRLRALLLVVGLFSLGLAGDLFVLVRATELGLADYLVPVVWVVLHGAKVVAALVAGRRGKGFGGGTAAAWGLVAAGLATVALWDVTALWIGAVVLGVGHGLREPWEKELVRSRSPEHTRGTSFGAYHLIGGFGALPAGLMIGGLWTQTNGQTALFASAAVVAVAAVALAVVTRVVRVTPDFTDSPNAGWDDPT